MKEKLNKRIIFLITSLYITYFISIGFFIEAFIAILRKNGASLEFISLVYMIGLFGVFKLLWAPIIDRFNFGQFGHYKIWIIISQFLMTIVLFFISTLNISTNLNIIVILVFIFTFCSSFLNVSLDAFVYKISFQKDYSTISAIKGASGLIGMVLGGGLGLIIYNKIDWQYTILFLGIITSLSLLLIFFYKEPLKNDYLKKMIDYKQFFTFWNTKRKMVWLLLLLVYSSTISATFGILTPILVDLNWSLDDIGVIVYMIGYSFGIVSSFGASYLIQKFGKKTILISASFGQIIVILLLLILFSHNNIFIVIFIVSLIFIIQIPAFVLINTLIMDLSSNDSPAFQIAMQSGIFVLSTIIFSSLAIFIAGKYGYDNAIYLFAILGIFSVYLSTKIDYVLDNKK
ncbi:MFS transporter [Aliarcobacter vitoriensis]|uniref:MFS transporter n=1 Tax=Aliarcobacter vitoriensis TaxID=2011099 RepID=A0A366MQ56_9BACT|nr:MFS transporter [Aliarcobacter vitoriensis]RBQ28147.1 MFS transporter [Aliarcobacter vitoriensis]